MNKRKSILMFVLGVITSFYVMIQLGTTYHQVEVDKTEKSAEEGISILTNADALPAPAPQINVAFHSYLIEVFEIVEETKETIYKSVSTTLHKALQLIIQEIISPNAP